jgi:hypothetical protein
MVFSLGLNNMPRISFKLRSSNNYDISNRRPLDEKWQELDFTLLLNSALKSLTLGWQIAVFPGGLPQRKLPYRGLLQSDA